jgi:hypothetical protein
MKNYPLLCGFRELVAGKGFVASVAIDGRALAVEDDDGWWLYGVNPGAIAESGKTLLEAHAALLRSFRGYVAEVAGEAADFSTFKQEVDRFYNQSDPETASEWEAALAKVRAGHLALNQLAKVETRKAPRGIRINQIARPTPKANELVDAPKMAA